jgi:two-component system, NtrC family, sensor kinase
MEACPTTIGLKEFVPALAESEQRYKRLLAATTDYIYSVEFNHGNPSTTHGPGCEAVTGYSPAEFASDSYLWYRVIHDEDRPAVMAQVNLILNDKTPKPIEHRIVHKNGGIHWIRNTPIPHRNDEGRLLGYDGLISDITERKEAENALRLSQERLALVIEGSSDGIWDWDVITGQIYFSPRWKEMLGYDGDEIQNTFLAWKQLLHPDDCERTISSFRNYFSGQTETHEIEHRLHHKDGTYRWILTRGVALRDPEGTPLRMAGSTVDITELKLAAERLKQANVRLALREQTLKRLVRKLQAARKKLEETQLELIQAAKLESLGTLAAGVAHEVKNPLQTILLGLDYLGSRLGVADKNLTVTLNDMHDAVNRANTIIRELLTLSANSDFHLVQQNLNQLIDCSLLLIKNSLVTSHIKLKLELSPNLPRVPVDSSKMEQVFINVFINSIQAMNTGGTLTVRSREFQLDEASAREPVFRRFKPGACLVVTEVQDTGPGLSGTVLARVFDPFFTTKPVGVGTGLGLSVAKKIVEAHGGNIEIKNAPGGGALVVIVLKP